MKDLITVVSSDQQGYSPIWDYEAWRIAMTLDTVLMHKQNIDSMAKHLKTDEAFILLEGKANIYIGDGTDTPGNITCHPLQTGKVLVVHPGTWHATETFEGCRILIVENRDTNSSNTVKFPIDWKEEICETS